MAKPKGMRAFVMVWIGQVFSMIGSQMTHFAMGIWAWEKTGQATPLAMVAFFSFAPLIIFSPIAGVFVDCWNRKWVMAISDIGAGLVTLVFLFPVVFPQPKKKPKDQRPGSFFRDLRFGFQYILKRKSLLYLQLVFFLGNLFFTVAYTPLDPMILATTGGNSSILGSVKSAGVIGGLLGGVILTGRGWTKKIHGVLANWIIVGVLGLGLMGLGRSLPFWLAAHFLVMSVNPLLNGSNQVIWQMKTAPEVQGRVFSGRRLVTQITAPLSMALLGRWRMMYLNPHFLHQSIG